ncbi:MULTISPECIES: hypothetical protein [Ruegeria]|uniref:Uncharacterized protein n=2 Tax=Ruegeria TaxID=97050 RepID=A0ABT3AIQ7_9RHOB|nr:MULTISPECIES: hypothetical protein [Ruegeria]MCG6558372.1 hypothetical protein [Ruegeria alba]MCV2888570.1 hypothetical protein [Ruegeria sp. XHP0148]
MSDISNLEHLRSEQVKVQALLFEAKELGDVVARLNFQSRLDAIREELELIERTDANVAEVALLFDGKPVRGQKSIDARFAIKALSFFQDIVAKLYAANSKNGLKGTRGQVAKSTQSALRITDLAFGSFGFVLQEDDTEQSSVIPTSAREALNTAIEAINELTQRDDDRFLLEIDEINPRLFSSLTDFFTHLHNNEASLKTNLPSRSDYHSSADIERAFNRLTNTKYEFFTEEWVGKLIGLSPSNRTFDFHKEGESRIVSGKFDRQISQDYLERIESDGLLLGARFRADIEIAEIRKPNGSVSITYTALGFEEIN